MCVHIDSSTTAHIHFHCVSVAYTADEVQYKWLGGKTLVCLFNNFFKRGILGSTPVGYEEELQLSQFELQETYFRELNFTRSESGNC